VTPTIGLLGDVMLGRGVAQRLTEVPPEDVWSPELRDLCRSCDLVICNLECCISTGGAPTERIRGKPFFFRAPPPAIASLRAIGVGAVGLANNHALDFETDALADTLELLAEAEIAVTGAGLDGDRARRGAIVDADGTRVALAASADHPIEFAAGPAAPGIAYADLREGPPAWLSTELARVRGESELVVSFPHWGPNMTSQPAAWQFGAAATMQEAGADMVAGHSAHVFHGVGWGERGPVLYDLGDALDDYAVDGTLRNDLGILAIWRPGDPEAELELAALALDYCYTRLARGEEAEWIARRLERACPPLGSRVERVTEQRFHLAPA
jgi:poly-gamma-glutamate synthesis protein (capsule biosynthesis protein)